MAKRASTLESNEHFKAKEVIESGITLYPLAKYGNKLIVKTEERLDIGLRPDVTLYINNKNKENELIASLEIINQNRLGNKRISIFKNYNMTLLALYVNHWYDKFYGLEFASYEKEYEKFLINAFSGKNEYFVVKSQKDKHQFIYLNKKTRLKLIRYDVQIDKIDLKNCIFDFNAFDEQNKSYHLFICPFDFYDKNITKEYINTNIRKSKEKVYVIKSDKKCWIDRLQEEPFVEVF